MLQFNYKEMEIMGLKMLKSRSENLLNETLNKKCEKKEKTFVIEQCERREMMITKIERILNKKIKIIKIY